MADVDDSFGSTMHETARNGSRLSTRLYTFSEIVSTASSEMKTLARDVSLTSSVLQGLAEILQHEESAKLYSSSAVQETRDGVAECEVVFKEINDVLTTATASVSKRWPKRGGKVVLSPGDRTKWPFLQPKMALLRGNLERLKSTLVLMLNVLTYAKEQRENKHTPKEDDIYQKTLLENLLHASQQATRKYEMLLKALESQGETSLNDLAETLYQDPNSGTKLDWTVRDSLKRVERALLQYDRSAPISYGNSNVTVQIEVQKNRARSRNARERPTPWLLVSIDRKEQEYLPSYNESWIPSEGEMYGSIAAGALEGLTVEDDYSQSQSRSRSRVRFDDQGRNSYQGDRRSLAGPSRGNGASPAEYDESAGLMHGDSSGVPRRGDRLVSPVDRSDPRNSGAVKFQKGARTKTWYSSIFESISSPTSALNTLQNTVKNSGLFLGLDDDRDHPETVLEYKNSRLASPPNSPRAKLMRSSTFDEMLRSPSSEGQFTPPSTVVSKEESHDVEKHAADVELQAPKPISASLNAAQMEQKIPFLVPADDEGRDISGRTTPDAAAGEGEKMPEIQKQQNEELTEGGSLEPNGDDVGEKKGEEQESTKTATEAPSKGKGKAREVISEGPADEVDELLKAWTTVYEE